MTLLQICQDAADEIGLETPPVSIIGNPDPDARRLLRFCTRVCRDLVTRAPWQVLRTLAQFNAAASEKQFNAIPADFGRFVPETFWERTKGQHIVGPVSPVEFQSRRSDSTTTLAYDGAVYSGPLRWFTRRGNSLLIYPAPSLGEVLAFEYQSLAFCVNNAGTPQTAWLADTDEPRLSAELITLGVVAMFLQADGQPAQAAMAAYERRLRQEISNDAPAARVLVAADVFGQRRRFTGEPGRGGRSSVESTGEVWSTDSDLWGSDGSTWGGS